MDDGVSDNLALFPTPDVRHAGPMPVCWSYGMGAESTAGLYRTIVDPTYRPRGLLPDLSNLVVLIAQTGDEWSTTISLVEKYVLPLLRQYSVRVVEVARRGPSEKDGIVVLQDTRHPVRLHADAEEHGFFALSMENRANGVMPQLGGRRLCSAKAKGFPLDRWRELEWGRRPYIHAVGFNVDEESRMKRDEAYSMGGRRIAIYPIHAWRWTRQDCIDYLKRVLRVDWDWPKSCCRQCGFAGGRDGWPEQLARFIALPDEAAPHIVDEDVAIALNSKSGLFGPGKSLRARLERDGAARALTRATHLRHASTWALYRVRRLYWASAVAWRSVETVFHGDQTTARALLSDLAHQLGRDLHDQDGHPRLWIAERAADRFPSTEEFYVVAPDQAQPKQRGSFARHWVGHASDELLTHGEEALDALDTLLAAVAPHLLHAS